MSRIEELEKRLAADPSSRMFVQLAEEYRKAGMLEQAIDCCEKGLKKHPQYPSARVLLGRALLEAGSFDKASAEFETVLKQVPDNILAHKFLGETYEKLGRLDEALKKYKVASALAPEDTELGERIQQVQASLAGGGPRPAPAAAAPPLPAAPAAVPPASRAPEPPYPAAAAPRVPTVEPLAPQVEPETEDEPTRLIDLPPIPLVEVDEPMVLETRDYIPPPKAPAASASAPVPKPAPPPPAPETAHGTYSEIEPEDLLEPTVYEPIPLAPLPAAPAPSPPKAPAPAPAPPPPPVPEIETATMAEIYASQGHFEQALAVYRKIVERQPNETQYRDRIEELLRLAREANAPKPPAPGPPAGRPGDSYQADERTVRILEDWLEAIRKTRGA
jgi:tetratricopeptide (TPR) repeat protein